MKMDAIKIVWAPNIRATATGAILFVDSEVERKAQSQGAGSPHACLDYFEVEVITFPAMLARIRSSENDRPMNARADLPERTQQR